MGSRGGLHNAPSAARRSSGGGQHPINDTRPAAALQSAEAAEAEVSTAGRVDAAAFSQQADAILP